MIKNHIFMMGKMIFNNSIIYYLFSYLNKIIFYILLNKLIDEIIFIY